ncbi:DNA polymerase III subunit delta' [Dendrosporobacter sp. 1207_IL3150]|uniref:DNA polymerase III subunit delta' n=1 Tax=Dendrosporobacter sp. 1207_IL3150 TaxID=3084054 RepID=UPI002FDB656A
MQWDDIVGNSESIERLKNMLNSNRMPHAMLFTGPSGIGKTMIASMLAAAILCSADAGKPCGLCQSCKSIERNTHPDLLTTRPEGTSIKIEQIRQLQQEVALAPLLGSRRVCIIEDAELMTVQAANSILKTLEEPQGDIIFILISSKRQLLLETIISRCLSISFQPLKPNVLTEALILRGYNSVQAETAARLSGGKMGKALTFLVPDGLADRNRAMDIAAALNNSSMKFVWDTAAVLDKLERKEFLTLLEYLSLILRDMLMIANRQDDKLLYNFDLTEGLTKQAGSWSEYALMKALKEISKCRQSLQANANPRLTGEALLIKLRDLAGGG